MDLSENYRAIFEAAKYSFSEKDLPCTEKVIETRKFVATYLITHFSDHPNYQEALHVFYHCQEMLRKAYNVSYIMKCW